MVSVTNDRYFSRIRSEVLDVLPVSKRSRVLSLGCGYGLTEANLVSEGSEVWGIEKDPKAAGHAAERLTRVICADLDAALTSCPRAYFDCLMVSDVLEHVVDPWRSLAAYRETLAGSGVVVGSMPNIRFIGVTFPLVVRGSWRYADDGVLDRTHLRFFGKGEIRELFESAGFCSVRVWPRVRQSQHLESLMNLAQRCWYKLPIVEGFLAKQYLVTAVSQD